MTQSSNMKLRPVGITGIGAYVPDRILTNAKLATMNQLSDEWIRQRTGVRERRICFALDASKQPSTGDRRRTTSRWIGHEILCT